MGERPQLLRIPEAADALQVSRTTMYRLIRDGEIKTLRVGQRQRIDITELNSFIEHQKESAKPHGS
jgi:excisionase family DNA binding protein